MGDRPSCRLPVLTIDVKETLVLCITETGPPEIIRGISTSTFQDTVPATPLRRRIDTDQQRKIRIHKAETMISPQMIEEHLLKIIINSNTADVALLPTRTMIIIDKTQELKPYLEIRQYDTYIILSYLIHYAHPISLLEPRVESLCA